MTATVVMTSAALIKKKGTLHLVFADRRATARTTTFVEPCCIQTKKEGAVLSRSVTSCAGMTAYLVLLAQTRVGFLFFLSDGCMAQRGRCPGGRPSVSANKRIHNAYYSVVKWQLYKPSSIQNMISSLPESAVIRIGESNSIQQLINKGGDNSKIVGRVGFLSGGRGKTFHQLTQQEQDAQKEAFARATVALTRAQQICVIMGPWTCVVWLERQQLWAA